MTALNHFKADPLARGHRRADLARVKREFTGPGGSPTTVISLPVTLTRCAYRVTIPPGQGACTEAEHDESCTIVVDEIFAGPAIDATQASELEALVKASLVADERYPEITSGAAAMRMLVALAGEIMGISSVDDQNQITILAVE